MTTNFLLFLIFQLAAASLFAADWPRWRGPDNTGHVPAGVAVPETLPDKPKIVWETKIGDGFGSPVVSSGHVFHLDVQKDKDTLHAVAAATGQELWSAPVALAHKDNQTVPGPRTTPLVDGDRVYVQATRGALQCRSAADGRRLWAVDFVKDFGAVYIGERGPATGASRHGYTGSPVIAGDRLIVNVGGTNGASVVCFNKLDGRVLWKSQNDIPGYSGPTLAMLGGVKQVIAFTAEAVIGLDLATGALLWRVPVKTQFGRHIAAPVVVDDLVIVSSHQAGLLAIRVANNHAEIAWTNKQAAINMSSPVAVGQFLYGLGAGKKLICVNVRTGEKMWANNTVLTGALVKDHAGFIAMHETILVLTYSGQLLLLAADPKECRVISSIQLSEKTWCNPAYADGNLYLRDATSLKCVRLLP